MIDGIMSVRPQWHAQHLDALRGIAILAVICVHTSLDVPLPHLLAEVAFSGQRGVQLFFIVSAFTLTLSNENRRSTEVHRTGNFFLRRFFRLAPAYYTDILFTILFAPKIAGTLSERVLGFLFLHGLSESAILHVAPGTWSIADEALFYACLPLLLRAIRSLRSALIWFAVVAPSAVLISFLVSHSHSHWGHWEFYTFFWFPIELPVFLMGIVVYFFWKEKIASRHLDEHRRRRLSLLYLLGSAALYPGTLRHYNNHNLYVSSLGCALLVLGLSIYPWSLLVNRFTIFMGRISFSVYLLHFWLVMLMLRITTPLLGKIPPVALFALRFGGVLVSTTALATLTWLYVEESGIALGRRLIRWLEHRAPSPDEQLPVPISILSPSHSSRRDEQF